MPITAIVSFALLSLAIIGYTVITYVMWKKIFFKSAGDGKVDMPE
jgi:hypothetical protein